MTKPFLIISHPDDSKVMFDALKGGVEIPVGELLPLLRGEIGVVDCGFRFIETIPPAKDHG